MEPPGMVLGIILTCDLSYR